MNTSYAVCTLVIAIFLVEITRRGSITVTAEDSTSTTGKPKDEAVSDIREKFRQKFGKTSLRHTSKSKSTDVITVIRKSEVVDKNGTKTVTEKQVYHTGEEVMPADQANNTFTSINSVTNDQCDCICPNVEVNNKCLSHGVTRLKFVEAEPEVLSHHQVQETVIKENKITNNVNIYTTINKTIQHNVNLKRNDGSYAESCAEAMRLESYTKNGMYTIDVFSFGPTEVYCHKDPMDAGCAWTVFLRRIAPGTYFDRTWDDYVNGFGDISGNFFLGLEIIHSLTVDKPQEMGIFTNFETNDVEREKYSFFKVDDKKSGYKVQRLGEFSDTSALRRLVKNSKFSTKDKDNGDGYDRCAKYFGMGWWYSDRCKYAMRLSGVGAYLNSPTIMGLRPVNCATS